MTASVVSITQGSATAATAQTGALPSSPAPASGDLILFFVHTDGDSTIACDDGSYTEEYETDSPGPSTTGACYSKVSDGTETGTVAFTLGTSRTWRVACVVIENGGAFHVGTPALVTTSVTVNPPSIAPGVGSKDFLFGFFVHSDNNHTGGVTTWPTNYTGNQTVEDGLGEAGVFHSWAMATRNLTAASDDPGNLVWAAGTRNQVVNSWAVEPAAGGASISDINFTGANRGIARGVGRGIG